MSDTPTASVDTSVTATVNNNDMEAIVRLNLQFYCRVIGLTSTAKGIQSEIEYFDDYMGGPEDDNVKEKITYEDVIIRLYNLLVYIGDSTKQLADCTKRLCLREIITYCKRVTDIRILSEDELRAYSKQENPGVYTADQFADYQKRVDEIAELARALNVAIVKNNPPLYGLYDEMRASYEQRYGIKPLTKETIKEIIAMLENLDT